MLLQYLVAVGMATAMGSAMVTEMEMDVGVSGESPVEGWEMVVEQGFGKDLDGV
jgi:hypothetical protein